MSSAAIKRCKSVDLICSPNSLAVNGRQKYRGRQSLPKQSCYKLGYERPRRRRYRMRSPRKHRIDFYDELNEFQCLEHAEIEKSESFSDSHESDLESIDTSNDQSKFDADSRKSMDVLEVVRHQLDNLKRRAGMAGKVGLHSDQLDKQKQVSDLGEHRRKFGHMLWLHLQALFAGRLMTEPHIQYSLNAQDAAIMRLREQKMSIVEDILILKCEHKIVEVKVPDCENCIYWHIYALDSVRNFDEAICTVSGLLDRWDELAELYPHSGFMKQSIGHLKQEDELNCRLGTLRTWLGISKMLIQTLNQVGEYFSHVQGHLATSGEAEEHLKRTQQQNPHCPWPYPTFESDASQSVQDQIEQLFQSAFHRVVGRSLRLHGMLQVLRRLRTLTRPAVEKSCLSLLSTPLYAQIAGQTELRRIGRSLKEKYGAKENPSVFLVRNKQFAEMNLPSFRFHFLLLLMLPLKLVLHWLELRSEKVDTQEDLLTLSTLIEDSHDCLEEAIRVKNDFTEMCNLTDSGPAANHHPELTHLLATFDAHLDRVFQNYLSYVRFWAQTAAKCSNGYVEWNERIMKKVHAEWVIGSGWAEKVPNGELAVAKKFCNIGRDLLDRMVRRYLNDKFDSGDLAGLDFVTDPPDDDDFMLAEHSKNMKTPSHVFVLCRAFNEMIRQLRDRSLRMLHFIRFLSHSLEHSARYELSSGCSVISDNLMEALVAGGHHVLVTFPDCSDCNFIVLCTRELANRSDLLDRLLNATFCSESVNPSSGDHLSSPKYLLLIPAQWTREYVDVFFHDKIMLRPSLSSWTTLQHYIVPNAIYLMSTQRTELENARVCFESLVRQSLASDQLVMVDDFCACNDQLTDEVAELKRAAFDCVHEVWECARDLGQHILNGKRMEDLPAGERHSLRRTLLLAWNTVFECQKELSKFVSYKSHQKFFAELLAQVQEWVHFTTSYSTLSENIRWILEPLSSLSAIPKAIFASDQLTETQLLTFVDALGANGSHFCSLFDNPILASAQKFDSKEEILKPASEDHNTLIRNFDSMKFTPFIGSQWRRPSANVRERIRVSVEEIDGKRDNLLKEKRKIGHVLPQRDRHAVPSHFFKPRKAPFEWQRLENSEIGKGGFGSVYLAMNLREKLLLAVKHIPVCINNERSLHSMVEEVDILRTLDHPNLVKYYGVEVHTKEVLIFMEYCSQGTLARVCREGLSMDLVRRYTHYMFQAISYIHDQGIVHRDIKPTNIFLATGDVLKLGDFGCSCRLQSSITGAGELISYVGTTRYMAPEMQTNGGPLEIEGEDGQTEERMRYAGHGRAVDIWSAGCVVLEMLTGKIPYWYLKWELQVIYQLGMGVPPCVPMDVQHSEMAHSFLCSCFAIDPKERPNAKELLQHHFANIMPQELEDV